MMSVKRDKDEYGRFKSKGLDSKRKGRTITITVEPELEEALRSLPKGTVSERVRQWVREGMEREGLL